MVLVIRADNSRRCRKYKETNDKFKSAICKWFYWQHFEIVRVCLCVIIIPFLKNKVDIWVSHNILRHKQINASERAETATTILTSSVNMKSLQSLIKNSVRKERSNFCTLLREHSWLLTGNTWYMNNKWLVVFKHSTVNAWVFIQLFLLITCEWQQLHYCLHNIYLYATFMV